MIRFCHQLLISLITILLTACGGGNSSSSENPASTNTPSAPTRAAEPALTFEQTKKFSFNWTDVSDATFYRLMENPDGISGFTQIGSDFLSGTQNYQHIVSLYKRVNAQYILQSCNEVGCTNSSTISVDNTLTEAIGYIKASNSGVSDGFGSSISLSGDGNTLAVAAAGEDSDAMGVNGDDSNDARGNSGAVYIFTQINNNWSQQAYIKASNPDIGDSFAESLSLSDDGNTLAVGAIREASADGNQNNNTADFAGAVYIFTRSGNSWSQQAYLKASNIDAGDRFGHKVSLSGDSNTLAVGAYGEASAASGVSNDGTGEADDSAFNAGAVYVFTRTGVSWNQQAYMKASNTDADDEFSSALSLSDDGNTLAVGAYKEASNAMGVGGAEGNNTAAESGAVYVFVRTGGSWNQQAYIKASNTDANDRFGSALSLSDDGQTLVIGAPNESSLTTGINGIETDNTESFAGATYVFVRVASTWSQQAYLKASNTEAGDQFGNAISLSGEGQILVVGAYRENSPATGLNGDQGNSLNTNVDMGASYVYIRSGSSWSQQAYVKASNTDPEDLFGYDVSLNDNGDIMAAGAWFEDANSTGVNGNQTDDTNSGAGAVYIF